MNSKIRFQKATQNFQKKYGNSTSADLQSFTLGWMKANEINIKTIEETINELRNQYETPFQGYQFYQEISYSITQFENLLKKIK